MSLYIQYINTVQPQGSAFERWLQYQYFVDIDYDGDYKKHNILPNLRGTSYSEYPVLSVPSHVTLFLKETCLSTFCKHEPLIIHLLHRLHHMKYYCSLEVVPPTDLRNNGNVKPHVYPLPVAIAASITRPMCSYGRRIPETPLDMQLQCRLRGRHAHHFFSGFAGSNAVETDVFIRTIRIWNIFVLKKVKLRARKITLSLNERTSVKPNGRLSFTSFSSPGHIPWRSVVKDTECSLEVKNLI